MYISAQVEKVNSKNITLKSGPRAGSTAPIYSIVVDGKNIDVGFKNVHKVGDTFSAEITDEADRWGSHKVVTTTGKAPRETVSKLSVSGTTSSGRGFAFPIPKSDHATSICRQNALTAAVNFLAKTKDSTVEDVLNTASQFAKWTTGQAEQEAAEEIMLKNNHEPHA